MGRHGMLAIIPASLLGQAEASLEDLACRLLDGQDEFRKADGTVLKVNPRVSAFFRMLRLYLDTR